MSYVVKEPDSPTAPWYSEDLDCKYGEDQTAMATYSAPIPQMPVIKNERALEDQPESYHPLVQMPISTGYIPQRELSDSPTLRLGEKRRKAEGWEA